MALENITFIEDYRCWKAGDSIDFLPGVNIIVGDQGSGKSSLFSAIKAHQEAEDWKARTGKESSIRKNPIKIVCPNQLQTYFFDFEKNNLRTLSYFKEGMTMMQVQMMHRSHGEANLATLAFIKKAGKNSILLMDEPDQSLSIRSILGLTNMLKNVKTQIIAAVHHPYIIEKFDQVYSAEHKQWITGNEFIGKQHMAYLELLNKGGTS